jgi:hypothetical protein
MYGFWKCWSFITHYVDTNETYALKKTWLWRPKWSQNF